MTELTGMLAALQPALHAEDYVFVTVQPGGSLPPGVAPFATVDLARLFR